MNRQESAQRATVAKVLADMVQAQSAPARTELRDHMVTDGVDRQRAVIGDKVIGVTTLVTPKTSARVVDEAALLEWVRENHPTEVETVTQIRPAFRTHILDRTEDFGGVPVDPLSGEVIPGLEIAAGSPYVRVMPVKDAPRIVVEAIRSGVVDPLALPAGDA